MKKIFTFLFAALMSVSMFASMDVVPSDVVLHDYYNNGDVCVCIYVPTDMDCNNKVLTGSFNGWSTTNCPVFEAVEGYDGWYVASFEQEMEPDESKGMQAKPVMLSNSGAFDMNYQVGAATAIRGGVEVQQGAVAGEIELINYGADAPNVYFVDAWKNNPCTAQPEPELELDKTVGYVAFPTENRPASIELAGVNRDFTWPMAALQAAPWYITDYNFDNYLYTAVSDTIKFRDAANNAIVLCEFIPANGGQEGRWQQYYLKMADYEMALEKGTMVRLIEELDLTDATKYAWMENAPEPLPTGIESIQPSEVSSQKVIRNGMLLIEKNGKIYNVQGVEVK